MVRSSAFRRFSSRRAFEVNRNLDSESQYSRSALSQLDQEESVEEDLEEELEHETLEHLCLFA